MRKVRSVAYSDETDDGARLKDMCQEYRALLSGGELFLLPSSPFLATFRAADFLYLRRPRRVALSRFSHVLSRASSFFVVGPVDIRASSGKGEKNWLPSLPSSSSKVYSIRLPFSPSLCFASVRQSRHHHRENVGHILLPLRFVYSRSHAVKIFTTDSGSIAEKFGSRVSLL